MCRTTYVSIHCHNLDYKLFATLLPSSVVDFLPDNLKILGSTWYTLQYHRQYRRWKHYSTTGSRLVQWLEPYPLGYCPIDCFNTACDAIRHLHCLSNHLDPNHGIFLGRASFRTQKDFEVFIYWRYTIFWLASFLERYDLVRCLPTAVRREGLNNSTGSFSWIIHINF